MKPYLVIIVLTHCVIFRPVLGMIMGEEEHVAPHALYVRVALDEVMILQFRIERSSELFSALV